MQLETNILHSCKLWRKITIISQVIKYDKHSIDTSLITLHHFSSHPYIRDCCLWKRQTAKVSVPCGTKSISTENCFKHPRCNRIDIAVQQQQPNPIPSSKIALRMRVWEGGLRVVIPPKSDTYFTCSTLLYHTPSCVDSTQINRKYIEFEASRTTLLVKWKTNTKSQYHT